MTKNPFFIAAVMAVAATLSAPVLATTLKDVVARGTLNCGVSPGLRGYSFQDDTGDWFGFDVAVCRAVAAAVLGDQRRVTFVPTTGASRFPVLESGEVDLLSRTTTWTYSRDTKLKTTFVGVNYYDGQGFMVKKFLDVEAVTELRRPTVCVVMGSTTELNLADFFKTNNLAYEPVPVSTTDEAVMQYEAGACDVYTTDASALAAMRTTLKSPAEHLLLPEIISKEPLSAVVRHGDDQWAEIVNKTINALIAAEEFGVTGTNIDQVIATSERAEVKFLLGVEGDVGASIGLDKDWAKRAILAGGNYGEIFAMYLGVDTPLGLARGLNAQWAQGGLLYAMPFR